MGKFFKKKPEKCSICHQEKIIYKEMKRGFTKLSYCKECYDEYYKRVEGRVREQVEQKVKSGQKIGMKEALDLTKQISEEIQREEFENAKN